MTFAIFIIHGDDLRAGISIRAVFPVVMIASQIIKKMITGNKEE